MQDLDRVLRSSGPRRSAHGRRRTSRNNGAAVITPSDCDHGQYLRLRVPFVRLSPLFSPSPLPPSLPLFLPLSVNVWALGLLKIPPVEVITRPWNLSRGVVSVFFTIFSLKFLPLAPSDQLDKLPMSHALARGPLLETRNQAHDDVFVVIESGVFLDPAEHGVKIRFKNGPLFYGHPVRGLVSDCPTSPSRSLERSLH